MFSWAKENSRSQLFYQCQISITIKEPGSECPRPQCAEPQGFGAIRVGTIPFEIPKYHYFSKEKPQQPAALPELEEPRPQQPLPLPQPVLVWMLSTLSAS